MLNKAYIDLVKLKENAEKIRKILPRTTLFNAVVKADGYGHGGEMVANALYKTVDSYSVALVEEGVKLRLSAIDKDILVLSPIVKEDVEKAVYYDLTITVDKEEIIDKLESEGERQNKNVFVHIKYNTGMNRIGVDNLDDLDRIIKKIYSKKRVKLGGMYSHFPVPENKKAVKYMENKFLLANNLVKGYNRKAICHISSSGGFLQGVYYDMVRIGILLYGYTPFKTDKITVEPVMKIVAPVVKRRWLNKGEGAFYGLKESEEGENISIIRYGYADGMERKEVKGQFNNRCMDLTAVTDCGKDEYVVLDDADKLSEKYGTISYEILTKSAMRAEKIYLY